MQNTEPMTCAKLAEMAKSAYLAHVENVARAIRSGDAKFQVSPDENLNGLSVNLHVSKMAYEDAVKFNKTKSK